MNLDDIIWEALCEDLGDGDHTSRATIPSELCGQAVLLVKEPGIICGVNLAKQIFHRFDSELFLDIRIIDGTPVNPGDHVFFVTGKRQSILACERLVLNFMQRMSGIATATRELSDLISGSHTKILDTRKTTPLLRNLEKYAVRTGGGENHRMGLYDMIMIKDNHADFAGGITKAIQATHTYLTENKINLKIEIEVRDFSELQEVLTFGKIDRIMLDNFNPTDLALAVKMIDGRFETEASGGITKNTIRDYASTGVDFISVGALTHQIKSLDLSLKVFGDAHTRS